MSDNEIFWLGVILVGVVLVQSWAIGLLCKELCRLYDDRAKVLHILEDPTHD